MSFRHPSEYGEDKASITAKSVLGHTGRLVCGSKSMYREMYPEHIVVFNANVFAEVRGKIWYGDIDLSLDQDKLYKLAKALNETIYVLYEHDGRFDNENIELDKVIEKAVWNSESGINPEIEESHNIYIKRLKAKRKKVTLKMRCEKCGKLRYRPGELLIGVTEEEGNWENGGEWFCKCKGWLKYEGIKGEK